MASDRDRKAQEREKLKNIINQWNVNRLDIFWLSEPNEDLEFHGAMRFYFQDAGQKVATKCIRVSSTATTTDVIETLIEKFRPDIRMLSIPEYALYEIHENGEERKLGPEEFPLWVQLDWHKDDREGRFLLRRMDEKSYISSMDACDNESFKRKLSKREKKDKKKKEKREKLKAAEESKKESIAERLYSELPETSFTRSISNPEAVMQRRRKQILERKLQQFCQEGGTDAGGTLRIFGESLNKDVPYKTLLLSTKDTASYVVKEILEKYGYDKEDPVQYCLVQVIVPPHGQNDGPDFPNSGGIREYILDDDDCPLTIQHQHNRNRGTLTFHVRRRPADYQPRKRKKKPKPTKEDTSYHDNPSEKLPYLLELNPDGTEPHGPPKKHRLYLNVTEVGSERSSSTGGQYLQLFGPNVQPRHCVIAHTEQIVTVTPCSRDAETYVNNMRIYETTILQNGMVVRFGKLHTFRFVDPLHDQKHGMLPDPRQHPEFIERSRREDQISLHHHGSYETTFDADGNVETVSTHSRDDRLSKKSDDALSHRSLGRESTHGRNSYERFEQKRGNDPILPAVLEFWEEGEDAFLAAAISNMDPSQVQFNLSPTYALYMAARYRASTHFRPETTPNDRAHRLTALMNKVATVMHQVIQDRYRDAQALAFWLANTSELLHFLKQDRHLCAYTLDAQDLLAESVQLAFRSLVTCYQIELQEAMPSFLEDRDDINEEKGVAIDVLAVLDPAMSILRRCRVNAALAIQMFSQLFHFINMWLLNKVLCETRPNLCTRQWGIRLKRRLSRIEAWSEKQGLELTADCHLSRIVQAAHLLQAPKSTSEDLATISTLCLELNSLQLRTLLERYQPAEGEPHIPREFIEGLVKVSESTADEQARSEGREVKLEEDSDLQLPFLLPEDGYSCDIVRGVPAGLQEFLQPLIQAGLCRLTIQPTSSGYWTIYMSDQDIGRMPSGARSPSVHSHADDGTNNWKQGEPEIVTIRLQKSNNGIGLSIVAAGGADQDKLGIYVKSVVKGGAADLDGRLQAGDQLLKVDGHSLVGVNQEKAAELMTRTGPVVTLEVAKQGAIYNGLSDLLSKPSPIIQREITLLQRQHAFGLPPSGCESCTPQIHQYQRSNSVSGVRYNPLPLPIAAQNRYMTSLPHLPQNNWDASQTMKNPVEKHNALNMQLKLRQNNGPSQFAVYPYRRNLVKPRSEDSLLNDSLECPCPFCQTQNANYTVCCKTDRSAVYEVTSNYDDFCAVCSHGRHFEMKTKQAMKTYYCIVCKSDSFHHCGKPQVCSYQSCSHQLDIDDINGNCRRNRYCVRNACWFQRNLHGHVKKSPMAIPLPARCSSSETLCSTESCQSDTAFQKACLCPRRMSERDIPSRLMNEHIQDNRVPTNGGHLMPARMQSSKSVPSLNSNHEPEPVRVQTNGPVRPHDAYNPGYSRTSSTASIPKATDYPDQNSRSKSTNNLRQEVPDPRMHFGNVPDDMNPPPYPGPPENSMANRPLPHPGMPHPQMNMHHSPQIPPHSTAAIQEERHYQNISMYQQPPPSQQHPLPQQNHHPMHNSMYQQPPPPEQHPLPQQNHHPMHNRPSQPLPQQPPRSLHSSQSSLNRPDPQGLQSPVDRARPVSTLVSPREQEQYVNSMGYMHANSGPPRSPKGSTHSSVDSHHGSQSYPPRPLHDQRDFRSADHLRSAENEHRPYSDSMSHPDLNRGYPMHSQDYNMMHIDPRQRDLLRQEAKMEEMREEVRRREDRERLLLQQQQQQHGMGRGGSWSLPRGPSPLVRPPSYHHGPPPQSGHPHPPYSSGPPPPAPKPRPQFYNSGAERFQKPSGYPNSHEMNSYDGMHGGHVPPAHVPPAHVTPAHVTPGHVTPGHVTPGHVTPGHVTPGHVTPGHVTPGHATPGHATPGHVTPAHIPPGHVPPQTGSRVNNQPPPVVSYRYGPSGYPPRSEENGEQPKLNRQIPSDPRAAQPHGKPSPVNQTSRVTFELPQVAASHDKKESTGLMSPSPWEREEKEKLHKQRLEEARRARDEEIRELESRPHLTPQQEERLRALRLEQEFQRRAEELHGEEEEDDDDDLLDRAENRERKLKMQEDLERARQRRLEWEMQQTQNQIKVHQQMAQNEEWKRQQQSLEEQEGRLRHLRLEEGQRKMELEMAKNAEERLLREARRRQDELKVPNSVPHQIPNRPTPTPVNHQMGINNNQQPIVNNHQQMHLNYHSEKSRLDNANHQDVPPPLPTSPPPIEPSYQSVYSQKPASMRGARVNDSHPNNQNSGSDKLLEPPAPPTRKSSYEVTNQMSALSGTNRFGTSSLKNCDNGTVQHYPKKVSFHDPSIETIDCDANGNLEMNSRNSSQSYTLDDINEVLATPQNINTYSPGNTPGVIGTQEVYRDPRQRIEAERSNQDKGLTKTPGPEKLTFKEKMKMFAQEVGEPETPKDKVKISRAQRDIETNLNGS